MILEMGASDITQPRPLSVQQGRLQRKQGPDLRYLRWAIWRGGDFLAWTHFVELNISRDNSFGFELLDAFFANQNSLAEDEETIQIFSSKFF